MLSIKDIFNKFILVIYYIRKYYIIYIMLAYGLLQILAINIQELYVHDYKYEYKPNKNRFNVIDKRH
jgi:hypothetical protein